MLKVKSINYQIKLRISFFLYEQWVLGNRKFGIKLTAVGWILAYPENRFYHQHVYMLNSLQDYAVTIFQYSAEGCSKLFSFPYSDTFFPENSYILKVWLDTRLFVRVEAHLGWDWHCFVAYVFCACHFWVPVKERNLTLHIVKTFDRNSLLVKWCPNFVEKSLLL